MTLNEILQNITILTNNSASPTGFAWECIVLCGIACCIMIAWLICEIINYGHTSVKIFAGFMVTLFAACIIGGILLICNEDMHLAGTVVNLYVRFNDVTIEDMSQYFKISNMTAANEGIYADITPIAEYSMEIKHALNSMGVI